ncbi:DUF6261 family protein [Capnocytophaga sp.]|uniref:DUF6261 family protein n=1 Tax=Capnocytophaga sp. TaxID=44737 RepID=UPI0026DC40A8|nr:DUF6261 family protein [Capnocytophaga sp.]MDO5105111.1 DUF6261 family protein [Capnocytophaga sp.]
MESILEIKGIKLGQLNNDEYAQFITEVVGLLGDTPLEKIFIKEEDFNQLKERLSLLSDVIRRARTSKETNSIAELDKQRNKLLVFLFSLLRVEKNNINKKRSDAATALYNESKNYLGIQKSPIRQKTHSVKGLLIDLNKPENKMHVATLGIENTLEALAECNQEFQKLVSNRSDNRMSNKLPSAQKLRNEISALYKHFTTCAYAMNIIHPTDESTNFINRLNRVIEEIMAINKQRLALVTSSKKITPLID